MCVIALHKPDKRIEYDDMLMMQMHNPNGMGLMFSDGEKLIVKKYVDEKDFDVFYLDYEAACKIAKSPIVVHFRMATHGKRDLDNTHPFLVNENLGFVHNGILSIHVPKDSPQSDTSLFNTEILQKLPPDFIFQKHLLNLIDMSIGNDKIVFMTNNGTYAILNEAAGKWENGIWYSNMYWQQLPYCRDIPRTQAIFDEKFSEDMVIDQKYHWTEYCEDCGMEINPDDYYNECDKCALSLCEKCHDNHKRNCYEYSSKTFSYLR